MNIKQLNELLEGAESYISWRGYKCWRTYGGLDYYFLKCQELGLEPTCIHPGISYEAQNEWLELDYCEHDIIIRPKKFVSGTGPNGERGKQLIYYVIDEIKKGLEIWNIGEHAPRNIIPLTKVGNTFHINEHAMYAIISEHAQDVMNGTGYCKDSIAARKKYIKKYSTSENFICSKIRKAIEILEKIDKRGQI